MNNNTKCWIYQYSCISGLSKQQVDWLCMFTVDEFNALLLKVIPYEILVGNHTRLLRATNEVPRL